MKQVSQVYLDELSKAHGSPRGIMQVLSAVETGQYIPLENLLDSVKSLSTDLSKHQPNAYIFASGSINTFSNVEYTKYTEMLAQNGDRFATIGGTQASRFLEANGGTVKEHLENTIKASGLTKSSGTALEADDLLHGYAGADGKRVPGLWDDISRGYAENAQGHVITVTPNASAERIFVQTELPALLENPKIETINSLPKQAFVDELDRLVTAGLPTEQAYKQLSDTLVKSSSISLMDKFAVSQFKADLGTNMRNDFTASTRSDVAALTAKVEPEILNLKPLADGAQVAAEKAPITLRSAFEAVAPVLITAGKVASFIPIVGTALGIGINTAEAAELQENLQRAIDNGDISQEALLEYNTILVGHIAQGGDPTVVMGEAGVQKAFSDWADRNNVEGELRESLQPQSLALMAKSGAEVVADAAIDVGQFGAQKTMEGVNYLASSALSSADSVYDYMSGNSAQMQGIYDALPVLDTAANDDLYDPSHLDTDPIHNYPTAHDMAQIKTQIVNTQDMIEQINNGTKEPFNGMNKAESADFLQERITRLNDRFEGTYDAAKADGTLAEVTDYAAQYGAFNADKAAQSLAIQNPDPAANQSWDAPKTRALAM